MTDPIQTAIDKTLEVKQLPSSPLAEAVRLLQQVQPELARRNERIAQLEGRLGTARELLREARRNLDETDKQLQRVSNQFWNNQARTALFGFLFGIGFSILAVFLKVTFW